MAPERPATVTVRSVVLAPDLAELARAREFATAVAQEAGFGEARVFDIALLVSEAAANAIEHAPVKGQVQVKTSVFADRLEIHVAGPGEFQTPDRLSEQRSRGLGLPLMAKLSDHLALFSAPEGGTLLTLTFYRDGYPPKRADSPLPPGLSEVFETSDRLEAVFGAMPEGFAVFDDSLRCVYLNDAMAMMDGRPKAQLMGEVLAPPQREGASLLSLFEEARKAGAEVRRPFRHPIRDAWAEVSAIPFTGGYALFSRDMTERKRADGEWADAD